MNGLGELGDGIDSILGSLGVQATNLINSVGAAGQQVLTQTVTGQPAAAPIFGGMSGTTLLMLGVGAYLMFGRGKRKLF